jgi:hypothetical protein
MDATETDPNAVATTPDAGTAPRADDLSGAGEGAAAVEPQTQPLDEEFTRRLGTLDPTTLPVELRQRFEAPFKADHTRKTQELSEAHKRLETEKAAIFELARRSMSDKQAPAGPDLREQRRAQLLELATQGDQKSLAELIEMSAEDKVAPVRTQVTLQNQYEAAVRAVPAVKEHWNEIYQVLSADPVIGAMAAANGYQGASKVMMALGMEKELQKMRPAYETATKEVAELKAKLALYEKERTASLPSSTSRAGTTAGRPAMPESSDLQEIGLQAWLASGGTADTFR